MRMFCCLVPILLCALFCTACTGSGHPSEPDASDADASVADDAARVCGLSFEKYEKRLWPVPKPVQTRQQVVPQPFAGEGVGYNFAFDVGTHASVSTAWLDEEEDLRLVVQLSDGQRQGAEILRLVALLDGVQVPLLHTTGESTAPWFPLAEDGTGDESFAVEAAHFTQGAHTLALMLISAKFGTVVASDLKTILRGEGGFGARVDHAPQAEKIASEGLVPAPFSGDVWLAGPQPRELFQREGAPLPFRIFAEPLGTRCDDSPVPLLLAVLVDGQQLEIGEFGPFIRALPVYDELFKFETELHNVPDDDAPHALTLVLVQGDGLYTESAPGKRVPWKKPVLDLGTVWW